MEILFQDAPQEAQNLSPLYGVYVDTDLLQAGPEALIGQLNALEPGTAVLLDVKSKFGNFYYTTSLSGATQSDTIDSGAMDRLIHTLKEQGCYLIARLPAFRDSAFAQSNPTAGLALSSGALWTDDEQCYWLDPASQTVMANLMQICRELQETGFDEVVFTDFRIPDSGSIVYSAAASKDEILRQAARQLASCAGQGFTVSFAGFPRLPPARRADPVVSGERRPGAGRSHGGRRLPHPTPVRKWSSSPPAGTPDLTHTAFCAV